jgi:hypothetical protein
MRTEKGLNAQQVLNKVEELIAIGKTCRIDDVYKDLSIFDWWTDKLSVSRLKDMRRFLKIAIKYGYTGYVCFKVGVTGCANGMWAHKKESEDGYSPDGDCLYKSFTPAYNYWQVRIGEDWLPGNGGYDSIKTVRDFEEYMKYLKEVGANE